MSNPSRAFDAGYESARRAIADRARRRKKRDMRWTQEDYVIFNQQWEEFLAGWMQAIREDKQQQLSWEEFYFPEDFEDKEPDWGGR